MSYADVYRRSIEDPDGFWLEQAKAIDWDKAPERALFSERAPIHEWFKDAEVNTCWNAVDRHVAAGRGAQAAIIHDSPVTGTSAANSARLGIVSESTSGSATSYWANWRSSSASSRAAPCRLASCCAGAERCTRSLARARCLRASSRARRALYI